MSTTTTTVGFNTPTPGTEEDNWGTLLNQNWDKADDLFDGTDAVPCTRLTVYDMSSETDVDPDNGNIQYKTIGSNTTFTESFAEGDSVLLLLTIGSSAIPTWPTMEWVGGAAPTLANGKHGISLFHADGVLIGNYLGPVS